MSADPPEKCHSRSDTPPLTMRMSRWTAAEDTAVGEPLRKEYGRPYFEASEKAEERVVGKYRPGIVERNDHANQNCCPAVGGRRDCGITRRNHHGRFGPAGYDHCGAVGHRRVVGPVGNPVRPLRPAPPPVATPPPSAAPPPAAAPPPVARPPPTWCVTGRSATTTSTDPDHPTVSVHVDRGRTPSSRTGTHPGAAPTRS